MTKIPEIQKLGPFFPIKCNLKPFEFVRSEHTQKPVPVDVHKCAWNVPLGSVDFYVTSHPFQTPGFEQHGLISESYRVFLGVNSVGFEKIESREFGYETIKLSTRRICDCHCIVVRIKFLSFGRYYYVLGVEHHQYLEIPPLFKLIKDKNERKMMIGQVMQLIIQVNPEHQPQRQSSSVELLKSIDEYSFFMTLQIARSIESAFVKYDRRRKSDSENSTDTGGEEEEEKKKEVKIVVSSFVPPPPTTLEFCVITNNEKSVLNRIRNFEILTKQVTSNVSDYYIVVGKVNPSVSSTIILNYSILEVYFANKLTHDLIDRYHKASSSRNIQIDQRIDISTRSIKRKISELDTKVDTLDSKVNTLDSKVDTLEGAVSEHMNAVGTLTEGMNKKLNEMEQRMNERLDEIVKLIKNDSDENNEDEEEDKKTIGKKRKREGDENDVDEKKPLIKKRKI